MYEEYSPPMLSNDGAQLLADAIARRNASRSPNAASNALSSRHNTAVARSSAVRRARDPLRAGAPPLDLIDVRWDRGKHFSPPASRRPSILLPILLSGMAIGAVIVVLTVWLSPRTTKPDVQVAGAVEEQSTDARDSSTGLVVGNSKPSTSDLVGADIEPESIEVTIYDVDPEVNGVRSFALRLKSLSTTRLIATDELSVAVESATGSVTTFVRFEHATLPIGSSALATVRAEGDGAGPLVVVVRAGDVVIDSVPIG